MTAETFHADEFAHDAEICAAATPGPWSVQQADDSYSMNALIVTTAQGIGELDDCARNVALILLQEPRYADIDDKRWHSNAEFIARARTRWPELMTCVSGLRVQVESLERENMRLRKLIGIGE